jgi:hypothetical protein
MIESARSAANERRLIADAAAEAYATFLRRTAEPVFRMVGAALAAEKHPFTVFTPAGSIRLASGRTPDDYIEIYLDAELDPPVVMGRVSAVRGQRTNVSESPLKAGAAVAELTHEDVLSFLLGELPRYVAR